MFSLFVLISSRKLVKDMTRIRLGKYRHYKGRLYEVIGVAKHSEMLKDLVVYKPLYKVDKEFEGYLWARPLEMFLEEVEVDGKRVKRFEFIGEEGSN